MTSRTAVHSHLASPAEETISSKAFDTKRYQLRFLSILPLPRPVSFSNLESELRSNANECPSVEVGKIIVHYQGSHRRRGKADKAIVKAREGAIPIN